MGWRNFLALIFLAALWGPSFLFIKVAVGGIPPLTLVAGRVGIAAVLLTLVLYLQGRRLPHFGPIWGSFAVMGLFSNALPFVLISWGEIHVDSALAAILNGTTPLYTILLAHFLIADDRLTPVKIGGVILGFSGLALLIGPSLLDGFQATTWGLLAISVAAASYAVALVYARIKLCGLPPLVAPTAQLIMATVYILPLSLLLEQPFSRPLPTWSSLGALLALAVVGTALAFIFYYRLLEKTSATYVSMVTYMVPVVGLILGVVILNEQPAWTAYAGCALILAGVMVVNGVLSWRPWSRPSNVGVRP